MSNKLKPCCVNLCRYYEPSYENSCGKGEDGETYERCKLRAAWNARADTAPAGNIQGPPEENKLGHKYTTKVDSRGYAVCINCGCAEDRDGAASPCPFSEACQAKLSEASALPADRQAVARFVADFDELKKYLIGCDIPKNGIWERVLTAREGLGVDGPERSCGDCADRECGLHQNMPAYIFLHPRYMNSAVNSARLLAALAAACREWRGKEDKDE